MLIKNQAVNNSEYKNDNETRLFQLFVDELSNTNEYCHFFENIHDIKREESPDFKMITKAPLNEIIGIELVGYHQDATYLPSKEKLRSKQRNITEKNLRTDMPIETGGFYGIGTEIEEILKLKSLLHEEKYCKKEFQEYWLIIHSENLHPYEFLGDAKPQDVFLFKCNQALKKSNHPFSKVFLFCGEKGNSWICELAEDSKLLNRVI